MTDLLLNPSVFLGLLVFGAVVTPCAAFALWRARPELRQRWLIAAGAFGPASLILWFVHNAVLETVGFASVWSILVLLVTAGAAGVAAGLWIRSGGKREGSRE